MDPSRSGRRHMTRTVSGLVCSGARARSGHGRYVAFRKTPTRVFLCLFWIKSGSLITWCDVSDLLPFEECIGAIWWLVDDLMRKPVKIEGSAGSSDRLRDLELAEKRPMIEEYLTATSYDDDSPRVPSTLTVFVDEGMFKASLNDRDVGRTLFVSGTAFNDVLDVLEALLESDRPPWREAKAKPSQGQGRPPKRS